MTLSKTNTGISAETVLLPLVQFGICLVFLMPLVVTPSTFFPFVVGKALYSRTLIEITFGLWFLLVTCNSSYRPQWTWITGALASYLIASVVSGMLGVSWQLSFWSTYERMQGLLDLMHWVAFALVLVSVYRTFVNWYFLLTVNLAVSVVVGVLGIGQYFNIDSIIALFPFIEPTSRIESTLGNSTYVGAYALVNIFISGSLLAWSLHRMPDEEVAKPVRRIRKRVRTRNLVTRYRKVGNSFSHIGYWRMFWSVAFVVNLYALALSGTRGAFIGLVAAIFLIVLLYGIWGRMSHLRWCALGFMVVLCFALILAVAGRGTTTFDKVASVNPTFQRLAMIGPDDESVIGRWVTWKAGVSGFLDRPALGWGGENFIAAWGRHFDSSSGVNERFDQAHNKLVEELTTKGLVGLASYLFLWFLMFRALVRCVRLQVGYEQLATVIMAGAISGYFIQNLFLFDTPATFLQFILMFCYTVHLDSVYKNSNSHVEEKVSRRRDIAKEWVRRVVSKHLSEVYSTVSSLFGGVRSRVTRQKCSLVIALGVSVLMLLFVYYFNGKTYMAASSVLQGSNPHLTWEDRIGEFKKSIEYAPGLANYPRLALISQSTTNWNSLSHEERQLAWDIVQAEGNKGLRAEPQSWRLYYTLTLFYQQTSFGEHGNIDKAREMLNMAEGLAPGTIEIAHARMNQNRIEEVLQGIP